ncbi:DinB family protein [Muricauda sp. SCSIO 64092]|uniref:DinB family protein n=1 Tax=Allomuricauda sp. SCSIO 64092 TaxID=2908842 RepID=UPI00131E787C|nr:DinB family protein [Muricauda sp. SCSIO 64092]UOY07531.1 DinB family protein [Muricauda sp. SCSIO 64092]
MKKLMLSLLCVTTFNAFAQEDMTVQNSIQGMVGFVQGQVVQLAEAFDESQYDWRPAEGVRSVRESLLHIASANYFLASKMGYAPPEDVDFMTMEAKITGKDNVIAALKKSNAFILDKITQEETTKLGEEVDFGFMKMNRLSGLLVVLDHNGEHKGQLIAYARSNGVTPPWSAAQ